MPTTERLESAASFNALFTHRVRVNTINDVDAQVIAWLKQAYDLAGQLSRCLPLMERATEPDL